MSRVRRIVVVSAAIEKNLITIVLMTTVLCVIFMDICATSSVEYSPQRFWQLLVCMPVSLVIVHCMMVRLDDGLFGWRPKGSLDNCPPCFLLCFCCGCVFTVHADSVGWRLCPRVTCIVFRRVTCSLSVALVCIFLCFT